MPDKVKDKLSYELALVLKPELEADLKPVRDKIAKIIAGASGEVVKADGVKFERRELAYKIKGETHGLYGYYRLDLPTDAPNKISSVLNITDEVLRYLLTKVDTKVEAYLVEEAKRRSEHREDVGQDEKVAESDENANDNKEYGGV